MQILLVGSSWKNEKMGTAPTQIPFNFNTDLDYHLDAKKYIYQSSRFSNFLIITCLGGGMCSLSARVLSL